MTKMRQYVSFVMAVIIMNSAFNPYSVYADELSSESETEHSETESVTEAESELESETASEADTELENDGIYNDAEYIDDLMINDIAVYSNSRPKETAESHLEAVYQVAVIELQDPVADMAHQVVQVPQLQQINFYRICVTTWKIRRISLKISDIN